MPNSDIPVVGSAGYKPAPADVQRVQTFLKWLPAKTKPSAVVIIPSKDFANVAKKFGSSDTNIAFQTGGRAYINSDAFDPSPETVDNLSHNVQAPPFANQKTFGSKLNRNNLVEWALGHEVGHMNSNLDPRLQEKRDYLQNEAANDDVTDYNSPQGTAYQHLQKQVYASQGQFQPTSAPIATQLVPPSPLMDTHVSGAAVPPREGHTRVLVSDGQSLDIPHENVPAAIKLARDNGLTARVDLSHLNFVPLGRLQPVSETQPVPPNTVGGASA